MSKIVRYEFLGSWIIFSLMFLSGVGIPGAILYLLNGLVSLETTMDDPEKFLAEFRAGKWRRR
jgi:hypothetical protein